MLVRCAADDTITRREIGDFRFPLGVYPIEEMTPREGYLVDFEAADGDDDETGDWEQWPDRYVYDIVVSAERVEPLVRQLLSLMPGRVFPILDFIGHDAYREVDPYISYELVGLDHLTDGIRRYRPFFFEDGMCGFGALSDAPFMYLLVDEHKIITIRVEPEHKHRVDAVLDAFDLEQLDEADGPRGADAAAHEHRNVLVTPEDKPHLLGAEEIVEHLREFWRLSLNVDADANTDDDGNELGLTAWRCVVRVDHADRPTSWYAEVLLTASCLAEAEDMAHDAVADADPSPPGDAAPADDNLLSPVVVSADRTTPAQLAQFVRADEEATRTVADAGIDLAALEQPPTIAPTATAPCLPSSLARQGARIIAVRWLS